MLEDDNDNNADGQVLIGLKIPESVVRAIEEEAKRRGVSEDDVANECLARGLIYVQAILELRKVMSTENPLRELIESTDDIEKIERIGAVHGEAIVKQLKAKYHID